MKRAKILTSVLLATLLTSPVLAGCNKDNNNNVIEVKELSFSVGIESGKNEIEVNDAINTKKEILKIYTNGVEMDMDLVTFRSSNTQVATINQMGVITAKAPGDVNFEVVYKEGEVDEKSASLAMPIKVVARAELASGGHNFAAASDASAIQQRTEILGKLEKHAMDAHLTGITLFDNGGYVKYSNRVNLPTTNYITGYGFGLLGEGSLDNEALPKGSTTYPNYYHSAISQDTGTINAMNASGSVVGDLAGYITSSYWGTKMDQAKTGYVWYPILAKESIYKPVYDEAGNVTWTNEKVSNTYPVPMEKANALGMYKKWRIYIKTSELAYRFKGDADYASQFELRAVAKEDYEFIYQFLLTGKNGMSRGAEMAGDTTYGIKGAQKFYNNTLNETNQTNIDNTWASMRDSGQLGVKVGVDEKNQEYLDLEIINAVDEFTAMYTLSSSLCSPLPRAFFETIGADAAAGENVIAKAAEKYGNFNGTGADLIKNYVLNLGPYMLQAWTKKQQIVFQRNDDWFECPAKGGSRYNIAGIYNRVIDTSTDNEAVYKQFNDGSLDATGIPTSKVSYEKNQDNVYKTKGDSTFKLNVNSCTQEQWDVLFGKDGKINKNSSWTVKPWMSNNNFLNGLFFAINRKEFAEKRGVQPSINYFSDAYLSNPKIGESYNSTPEHEAAVSAYHTVEKDPVTGEVTYDNYGYDLDKSVQCFKTAVNQLADQGKITLGTKSNPTKISIHIKWMYSTDVKEYGEDIKGYFESAFNDPSVCDGAVKLEVTQDAVTNWEDVYNEWMMKGQFDLGFGAISGNTYNPLNFLEVLKTDNSSGFTLNWGSDTAEVDPVHPIIYNGEKWSFDGLWEAADHGGVVDQGKSQKAVKSCYAELPKSLGANPVTVNKLYDGYQVEIPVEFINVNAVEFDLSHLDIYVVGKGNFTLEGATINAAKNKVTATISKEKAQEINTAIFQANFKDINEPTDDQKDPFLMSNYNKLWTYELYYTITINGGSPSETYTSVAATR